MTSYMNTTVNIIPSAVIFQDIDRVLQAEDVALSDPLEFVRKLKNGEDIGLPNRLHIPEIPEVDWSKYKMQLSYDAFRPITRPKARDFPEQKDDTSTAGNVVRGRVKDKDKPSTFNQLWSPEEQLRLEELLVKYPPEANEARRFAKIAAALGNRTLKQVTSRCQKYFAKLHQAGLPIPGRPPRQRYKDTYRNPKVYLASHLKSPPCTIQLFAQNLGFPQAF